MRRISIAQKNEIRRLSLEGHSLRKISRFVNVSLKTVHRYLSPELDINVPNKGCRPEKTSKRCERALVSKIESGFLKNAVEASNYLKENTNTKISARTVRRILKKSGLKNYAKPKNPRLLSIHKKNRFRFARAHKNHDFRYWKTVIFSDETKFNLYGPDGNKRVWRIPNYTLNSHHVREVVKYGGGGVMIWGSICYNGVGEISFIEGTMNSAKYISILESSYPETLKKNNMSPKESIFQQDNDPKHTSRMTKRWLSCNKINILEWPSCSPDMNLIENVWEYVDRRIRNSPTKPKNLGELKERIREIWYAIPSDYIKNLFESMPSRINCLFRAKGGHTKY
jgi:transposase